MSVRSATEPTANSPAAGFLIAGRRIGQWFVFGFLPLLVFSWWVARAGEWGFDFQQFWQGGNDVVNGVSPYPEVLPPAADHFDFVDIRKVFRFPYPAGAAFVFAPLGALALGVASVIWGAVIIASLVAALWIIGVRDWRVAGVVLGSPAVIGAVRPGTVTPVLMLLLAVAWRWRDKRWVVSSSLASAIALKLFLWPLVVWLVATRRFAAALGAAGLATAITLGAWAAIGFEGLRDYPELVRRLAEVVADRGYSLVALGVAAGLPEQAAEMLPWLVGIPLLAATFVVARREDGDRIAFSVAIIASLAITPIVWIHYFALLVIPLALARPRLSWAWGLMWVFWITPGQETYDDLWRIAVGTSLTLAVLAVSATIKQRPITGR